MAGENIADGPKSLSTRARRPSAKYVVEEKERKVTTYPFSSSEILTLSVLNPAAAGLIGWGINVWVAWAEMATGKDKHAMGIAAVGLLVGGVFLQAVSWGLIVKVWSECRNKNP